MGIPKDTSEHRCTDVILGLLLLIYKTTTGNGLLLAEHVLFVSKVYETTERQVNATW